MNLFTEGMKGEETDLDKKYNKIQGELDSLHTEGDITDEIWSQSKNAMKPVGSVINILTKLGEQV